MSGRVSRSFLKYQTGPPAIEFADLAEAIRPTSGLQLLVSTALRPLEATIFPFNGF
jgi:hypothetical protein